MNELSPQPTDLVLPKRRFSAFFKTGLEEILHGWGVDTLAVAGVATHFCVLTTAMDGICHDFQVAVLEDCCASYNAKIHACAVKMYKRNALEPLLQFLTLDEFLAPTKSSLPEG
jgi:nicotinamidase-related amidase